MEHFAAAMADRATYWGRIMTGSGVGMEALGSPICALRVQVTVRVPGINIANRDIVINNMRHSLCERQRY